MLPSVIVIDNSLVDIGHVVSFSLFVKVKHDSVLELEGGVSAIFLIYRQESLGHQMQVAKAAETGSVVCDGWQAC